VRIQRAALIATAIGLALPGAASAQTAPSATVTAKMTPNVAGKPTSIRFGFSVKMADGSVPAPLTNALVHLPNIKVDTKGLKVCSRGTLEARGPSGCPAGSKVGTGTAHASALLGGTLVNEPAKVTAFNGTRPGRPATLLLYNDGRQPISVQLVVGATLTPDTGQFGRKFNFPVPAIPTVPGSPDASVVDFTVTIGATTKAKEHGRSVTHHLVTAPKTCPSGGWAFRGDFSLRDGSKPSAGTKASCRKG
jgi:hypothetical protein